jgi:hypothetical protein
VRALTSATSSGLLARACPRLGKRRELEGPGGRPMRMSLDELAERWASGASATEIARAAGLTRGMVLGQVHRRRKAGDSRFGTRPRAERLELDRVRKSRRRAGLPPPAARPRVDVVLVVAKPVVTPSVVKELSPRPALEPATPVMLTELLPGCCKFAMNNPPPGRAVEMLFCAAPVEKPGGNWCAQHAAVVRGSVGKGAAFVMRPLG